MLFPEIIKNEAVYTLTEVEKASVKRGGILLLKFVFKALYKSADTLISFGATEMTYRIPVQRTEVCMPVIFDGAEKIVIRADSDVECLGLLLEARGDVPYESTELESGMHILDEYERIELDEAGVGVGKSIDLVKNGEYIYSIGNGALSVTRITPLPHLEGRLSGLGSVRQIALCQSGSDVIVTSRHNGAYVINVSDPEKPYIRSSYDTVEMATGLCISKNTAFICSRQYGVEAVDISDLDFPRHIAVMRVGGEVQSCTVKNGVFYGGLWANGEVTMYDVSDPKNPTYLGSAQLTGKGDGLSVETVEDKTYLYAATGHHSHAGLSPKTPSSDLRFGQGNGLDIFDVSDPTAPVRLSTSQIDGRYYFSGYDYWESTYGISPDGHRFIYLVSTFNGIYVYDATDLSAPRRIAHVTIPIKPSSKNYTFLEHAGRTTLLPYDQRKCGRGAVGAIEVDYGYMYVAGCHTDLHVLKNEEIFFGHEETFDQSRVTCGVADVYSEEATEKGFELYRGEGQAYAVCEHNGLLYLSEGDAGITVLTPAMKRVGSFKTEGTVMWLEICGDTVYSAEKNGGLAVYRLRGEIELEQIYRNKAIGCVRHLRVSPDGKYIVLQLGGSAVSVIDAESKKEVLCIRTRTLMYHHNLTPTVDGRYIGFFDNDPHEWWIDFGEDRPVLVVDKAVSGAAMTTGITSYGNKALCVHGKGGLNVYRPQDGFAGASVKGSGFVGKPSADGDRLITCNRIYGDISIVDVSDINEPRLLRWLKVRGNPDIALINGENAYVPLGYQGLAKINIR